MIAGPVRAAAGADGSALDLPGQAGVVAVRLADLSSPGGQGLGKDGRTALAVALAIRFTLLMTLMPDADYPAVPETRRRWNGCRT